MAAAAVTVPVPVVAATVVVMTAAAAASAAAVAMVVVTAVVIAMGAMAGEMERLRRPWWRAAAAQRRRRRRRRRRRLRPDPWPTVACTSARDECGRQYAHTVRAGPSWHGRGSRANVHLQLVVVDRPETGPKAGPWRSRTSTVHDHMAEDGDHQGHIGVHRPCEKP